MAGTTELAAVGCRAPAGVLRCSVGRDAEGAVLVGVHGDLTLATGGVVAAVVAGAIAAGVGTVVIDARHLRRCDSAGAAAFVDAIRRVRPQTTSVLVTGAEPSSSIVLRVAALAGELTLTERSGAPA
jgi:anti-anti-sigma regulatory factor